MDITVLGCSHSDGSECAAFYNIENYFKKLEAHEETHGKTFSQGMANFNPFKKGVTLQERMDIQSGQAFINRQKSLENFYEKNYQLQFPHLSQPPEGKRSPQIWDEWWNKFTDHVNIERHHSWPGYLSRRNPEWNIKNYAHKGTGVAYDRYGYNTFKNIKRDILSSDVLVWQLTSEPRVFNPEPNWPSENDRRHHENHFAYPKRLLEAEGLSTAENWKKSLEDAVKEKTFGGEKYIGDWKTFKKDGTTIDFNFKEKPMPVTEWIPAPGEPNYIESLISFIWEVVEQRVQDKKYTIFIHPFDSPLITRVPSFEDYPKNKYIITDFGLLTGTKYTHQRLAQGHPQPKGNKLIAKKMERHIKTILGEFEAEQQFIYD